MSHLSSQAFFLAASIWLTPFLLRCGSKDSSDGNGASAAVPPPSTAASVPTPTPTPTSAASVNNCTHDAAPIFTANFVDPSVVQYIIPPGTASGDEIKPHSYAITGHAANYAVYAPVNSVLEAVVHYTETGIPSEYLLTFRVSCEVTYRFDHLINAVPSIVAVASATPQTGSGATGKTFSIPFKAGDLVAYSNSGTLTGGFDFGVYNTNTSNAFINLQRYVSMNRTNNVNSTCPYDYYSSANRAPFYAKFASSSGTSYPNMGCRSAMRDVQGAMSGAWFLDSGTSSSYPSTIAIGIEPDAIVRVAGLGGTTLSASGTDPATVTTEVCYSNSSNYAYLKILPTNQLGVAYGSGSCPGGTFDAVTGGTYKTYAR